MNSKAYFLLALGAAAVLNGAWGLLVLLQTIIDPVTDSNIGLCLAFLALFWGAFTLGLAATVGYLWLKPRPIKPNIFALTLIVIMGLVTLLILQSFRASPDPLLVANLSQAKFMIPVWMILGVMALCVYQPRIILPRLFLVGFSLGLTALLIEFGVRVILASAGINYIPAYVPDEAIGWKLAPNIEFEWAGLDPACVEFRTNVHANSLGFFDREHETENEADLIRVALFGDSYVMAREVPLEEKASILLENQLNAAENVYEVLNFGVTGFSVGQYIPLYETYARPYQPDVVFILVSEIQMIRTVTRENSLGIGGATDKTGYQLRPAFGLSDGGELERTYPENVAELQAALDALKDENGEFEPEPVTRILESYPDAKLWTSPYAWLITHSQGFSFLHRRLKTVYSQIYHGIVAEPYQNILNTEQVQAQYQLPLQFAVIQELARQIEADSGQLVIVDNSFQGALQAELQAFSAEHELGYLDLTQALQQAEVDGIRTTFPCDGHFNAAGNRVFSEVLATWFER